MTFQSMLEHELNFWKQFVTTERFQENWNSDGINPELEEDVLNLLKDRKDEVWADLGSGPVSILKGLAQVTGNTLHSFDPLAEHYRDIVPGCNVIKARIEHIKQDASEWQSSSRGFNGKYDIVHMRNAIDHTQDPFRALYNMRGMLKKGGMMIVHGFENEGAHENYEGFHKWNAVVLDGGVGLYSKSGKQKCFIAGHTWTKQVAGRTWYFVTQKNLIK